MINRKKCIDKMADRIPLIVNPTVSQIQELPNQDDLVLSGQLKLTGTALGSSDINLSGGSDAKSVITVNKSVSNLSQLSIDCENKDNNGIVQVAQFKVSGTNNTPSLSVTVPSGRTPIVSNTPSFRAQLSADQTIPNETQTVVAFATEDFDSDGCYNNTGSAVTLNGIPNIPAYSFCPNVAGFYYIFASTSIECSADELRFARVQIMKNGVSNVIAACVNGKDGGGISLRSRESTQTASIIVEMNGTGDYITIYSDGDVDTTGATLTLRCPPTVRSYVHAYKLIM